MAEKKLFILNLEDNPVDTELLQGLLEAEGLPCEMLRIETEKAFVTAIARGGFDLMLVDYKIPGFDGMSALAIAKEKCPDIPFIFVSGSIREDIAIEALKNGATDYILKDNLSRFVPAVKRALKEAERLRDSRRMEKALEESEERYRSLFDNSIDAVLLTRPDGTILTANPEACRLFGRSEEEICRLGREGIIDASDPNLEAALEERARTGRLKGELRMRKKDGSTFQGEVSSALFIDRNGDLNASMIIRDISERKFMEERLEKLNQTFLAFGPDALANIDRLVAFCGTLLGADCALYNRLEKGLLRTCGLWNAPPDYKPVDKPEGHICYDLITNGASKVVVIRNLAETSYFQTDPNVGRYKLQTYLGTTVRFGGVNVGSLCLLYRKDFVPTADDERLLGIIAGAIGTEEQRWHIQEDLKESGQFSHQIVESAQEGIIVYGRDLKYRNWNPFLEDFTGIPASEVLGRHPLEIFPFMRESGAMASIEKALKGVTSEAKRIEFQIPGADRMRWTSEICSPLRNASGEIIGVIETVRDITEHVLAEDAVMTAAFEWSASFDAMSDGVSIHDTDHTIISVNRSFCELLGKTSEELVGRKCFEVFHGKDSPIAGCPLQKSKDTNQMASTEIFEPVLNKWFNITTSPVFDKAGHIARVVHTVRDITERRNIESQLRHSQKMESIGTLAGGIAHDFNNILNVILGFGGMVMDRLGDDDIAKEQLTEVLSAAGRAASLTKRLLIFSRKEVAEVKPVEINGLIIGLEKMLSRILREDIRFVTDLMDTKTVVMADAGQIEQVLMNLVANARDAMPEGGSLTIKTELRTIDVEFVNAYEYGTPGTYAVISIADTGFGIDKEKQARIFDPFFTTKGVGKGTGLGLSMAYGIIKQHNGYIKVYSEPGKGTTFKLWLPVIEETSEEEAEVEGLSSLKGGTETILVAEDDASLRKLTKTILEASGYRVITAEDGEEALTQFMENREKIRLVILDMIMPKKNGREVSEAIRKNSPLTKILFVSGYTMDTVNTEELSEASFDFVHKPVLPKELVKKVRELLDR